MPIHRPIAALSAAAALLVLAACSPVGQSAASPAGSPADPQLSSAVRYAQCMRENGVNVPDPDPQGALAMPEGYDSREPKTAAAEQACIEQLPPRTKEEAGAFNDSLLELARCMRENGVDIPDPANDGELLIPMGDQDALKAAEQACVPGAPEAGQ